MVRREDEILSRAADESEARIGVCGDGLPRAALRLLQIRQVHDDRREARLRTQRRQCLPVRRRFASSIRSEKPAGQ